MKKILSLVCIFCLCFSMTFEISVTAEENITADCGAKILSDLEIISEVHKYDDSVTRADFTMMLVKALGICVNSSDEDFPFEDVSSSDECYPYVQTAYNLGIISPGDKFNPLRTVSYVEMVKMAVCAIGYEFLAAEYGGWPYGFVTTAGTLKMTAGINSSDANYGTAYALIYNTLTAPLPEVTVLNGNIEYSIHSGVSVLESVYKLTRVEGMVEGAQYFGGVSGFGMGEGNTCIDGIILKNGGYDTDSYFGCECIAYYDEYGEIKTFYTSGIDKNRVVEISSENAPEYSNLTYTYYPNDSSKAKKATISSDSLIVYNGKTAPYSEDIMMPEKGRIKLMKTGSGSYDVVIIDSYDEIVAGAINPEKLFVADLINKNNIVYFDKESYTSVSIFDQNGRKISFSDLEINDVLWISESNDKTLLKVLVSKNRFSGEYTGRSGEGYIEVDGQKYSLTKTAKDNFDPALLMGSVVMLYLNLNGEVCYVEAGSEFTSINVGYLTASKIGTGLDASISVKIFTKDGKMKIYKTAKSFLVNGKKFDGNSNGYELLMKDEFNTSSMMTGFVSYSLNNNNELTAVNYDNVLMEKVEGATYTNIFRNSSIANFFGEEKDKYVRYYSSPGVIRGKSTDRIFVKPSTLQFRVPRAEDIYDADDMEDYVIRNFSDISNGEYLTDHDHIGYTLFEGSMVSEYVVSSYAINEKIGAMGTDGGLYIVADISKGLDNAGEEKTILTVTSHSAENMKLYVKDDYFIIQNGIGVGDLLKLEYDMNDVVQGITYVYKAGTTSLVNKTNLGETGYDFPADTLGPIMNNNEGMGSISSSHITLARLYNREDSIVALLPYNYDVENFTQTEQIIKYNLSGFGKVIKFDVKTGKVSKVEYATLNDYMHTGIMCDMVVAEGSGGLIQSLYVYETEGLK